MASSMTSGWTEQATLYWSEAISLTLQVFAGSTVFQNLWVCYLAGSTKKSLLHNDTVQSYCQVCIIKNSQLQKFTIIAAWNVTNDRKREDMTLYITQYIIVLYVVSCKK